MSISDEARFAYNNSRLNFTMDANGTYGMPHTA
jgi:hypothetical protein